MATTYHSTYAHQQTFNESLSLGGISPYFVALGRVGFALLFVLSGLNHFSQTMVDYAAASGVPLASVLVPLSGVLAIVGGLSVALGYQARWGALLLIVFLIPVTLTMHSFWTFTEPALRQMQMIHFMKNLSLLGTTFLLLHFGSGPASLDKSMHRREVL